MVWSTRSLDSEWVRDEAHQAREQKRLIPVRLDNVQAPLGFRQAQRWIAAVAARLLVVAVGAAIALRSNRNVAPQTNTSTNGRVELVAFDSFRKDDEMLRFAAGLRDTLARTFRRGLQRCKAGMFPRRSRPSAVMRTRLTATSKSGGVPVANAVSALYAFSARRPRFMPFAASLGLDDYWLESDRWPDFCATEKLPYDCKEAALAARANRPK